MCCQQKVMFGKEFHVLHISADKKLHHLIISKDAITGGYIFADDRVNSLENQDQHQLVESSFNASNSTSSQVQVFKGVVDLLKAQRKYKFSIGGDPRPFASVAVADRGNHRVQVFRMFWERSEWYEPSVELVFVIGGGSSEEQDLPSNKENISAGSTWKQSAEKKKRWRFINLIDPVSVAYATMGELAICDSGAGKVYILSSNMDVVKTIAMNFISDDILAKNRRSSAAANAYSKIATSVKEDDPFDAFDSFGRETKQSHESVTKKLVPSKVDSPPCSVAFNESGSLAIGYKNGGVFITLNCQ